MTKKPEVQKGSSTTEWFIRGALARIGDSFDQLVGRKGDELPRLATSQLIERLERLLDAEAMEIEDKGEVVPHNIRLRFPWNKVATDDEDAMTRLENELLTAAADHINNSVYYTLAPLNVKIEPDYFNDEVILTAGFDDFGTHPNHVESRIAFRSNEPALSDGSDDKTVPGFDFEIRAHVSYEDRKEDRTLNIDAGGRLSVGRAGTNHLVLDHPSVSKMHAALSVGPDDKLCVADTGSTNGTFKDGTRLAYGKAHNLDSDDTVTFGSVEVNFQIDRLSRKPEESTEPVVTVSGDEDDSQIENQPASPGISEEQSEK